MSSLSRGDARPTSEAWVPRKQSRLDPQSYPNRPALPTLRRADCPRPDQEGAAVCARFWPKGLAALAGRRVRSLGLSRRAQRIVGTTRMTLSRVRQEADKE